ncbi:MAG: hypothetical protein ACPLKZ_00695, partial [Candidatus Bathyarchaeales archaeon]
SLQSCSMWVQLPSPAFQEKSPASSGESKYSLTLPKELKPIHISDVFKTRFNAPLSFLNVLRFLADENVIIKSVTS